MTSWFLVNFFNNLKIDWLFREKKKKNDKIPHSFPHDLPGLCWGTTNENFAMIIQLQ